MRYAQCGFAEFRSELSAIVTRKDADALLAVVDPAIKVSFGDENGRAAFERKWRLRDADSLFWTTFSRTLALGGECRGLNQFVAPYVYARWPERFDAFDYVAVTGTRVRLRQRADAAAPTIASLDYDIVKLGSPGSTTEGAWTRVSTADGRTGFIATTYLRSSVDYRAFFHRTASGWRMVTFVAGG